MIKPLTSLRFFFAFMVFLTHMNFLYSKGNTGFNWLYDHVFYEGYIGVSFFFILSGFILTHTYKEGLLNGMVGKGEFWLKRIARIYPLHIITLYISIPISLIEIGNSAIFTKQFFSNIFLLQSFGSDRTYFFSGNSLSWSISNEMFFYLCFPFLIFLFCHYKWIGRFLLLVACIAVPLYMPYVAGGIEQHTLFYINPFVRLIDFTLGIFLYDLYLGFKSKTLMKYASVLELFSLILFAGFLFFHESIPQADRYSCYYWIPISFIILVFAFQSGIISKILSKKVFVFLGEISFGFYMFHQLVIRYLEDMDKDHDLISNPYSGALIVLTITVLISAVSYFVIEKPLHNFILWKFMSKKNKHVRTN